MRALHAAVLVAAAATGFVCIACVSKAIDRLDDKVEKRIEQLEKTGPRVAAKSVDKALDKVEEHVADWWDALQKWLGTIGGVYAVGRTGQHVRGHLRKRRARTAS